MFITLQVQSITAITVQVLIVFITWPKSAAGIATGKVLRGT